MSLLPVLRISFFCSEFDSFSLSDFLETVLLEIGRNIEWNSKLGLMMTKGVSLDFGQFLLEIGWKLCTAGSRHHWGPRKWMVRIKSMIVVASLTSSQIVELLKLGYCLCLIVSQSLSDSLSNSLQQSFFKVDLVSNIFHLLRANPTDFPQMRGSNAKNER